MPEARQNSHGVASRDERRAEARQPGVPLPARSLEEQGGATAGGSRAPGSAPMKPSDCSALRTGSSLCRLEPLALMVVDFLATYVALFCAAWGTTKWATATGATGGLLAIGVLGIVNVGVFATFKMYNSLWRYASMAEALRILYATVVGSVCGDLLFSLAFDGGLSVRSYVMAWALLVIMTAGTRLAVRALWHSRAQRSARAGERGTRPRTLIVGAGQTGSLTIKRMHLGDEDMCGEPVALVDDDVTKHGRHVHGVKVLGSCDDIPRIAQECQAEQIVLACPSALASERQRILSICLTTGLRILTLPNVRDLAQQDDGRIALREVEISELLTRDEVAFDSTGMGYVRGQVVLVTGGGGSIGSELVRQLIEARPQQIVIFDVYENTAYELLHEMQPKATELGVTLSVVIGSVTNERIVRDCFERYRPKVVFHAAAHKHVPLMEDNAREAVENNVLGTWIVCRLAEELGCSHCILVSTDKAVNPTNVMGATKRLCELEIQALAQTSRTTVFAAVRFGNVLGSHGSVIPLFRRQLRSGGPLTVTHPDITRYFMTIPEAAQLVITAGSMAQAGEIFILEMGQPVRIYDLAVNLIKLSGLRVGRDIEVAFTGLRPGEKLYEELQMHDEELRPTENTSILVSTAPPPTRLEVEDKIARLMACLSEGSEQIKRELARAVPTYHPRLENSTSTSSTMRKAG
ncbi:polysaccharide biosynthesis protein [Actinomyces stomatis]|uniref:polysaccharide biosynthesis protein n=1 Tax=Actinomyces stomatis TaxID=3050227 RepID=UPI002852C67D|nr:nucleoside-diphosphate sugar epimerase/dehydratase [Actinomyces sp. PK606]